MAVTQRFSANPYRILRLSGEASSRDIHKAASQVRRQMSLGVDTADTDAEELGPCSRTEATIRRAIGQLENPVERLEHRLFWHLPAGGETPDDYQDVRARHDACIAQLIAASAIEAKAEAVVTEPVEAAAPVPDTETPPEAPSAPETMARALEAWRGLVAEDRFWDLMQAIELGGDFEPAAFPSEIDTLRKNAVRMAAESFIEGLRDALLQGGPEVVGPWLSALSGLAGEDWAVDLAEEAGEQLLTVLEGHCTAIIETLGQDLVREQGHVKANAAVSNAALNRYRSEVGAELNRLLPLVAGVPALDTRAREAAANCLAQVAGAFTWCDDFARAEKLFSEALSLSRGTRAELSLERGMEGITESARAQRRWGKKVDGAPALFTLNGCGVTLYGSDEYDAESGTSVATYYFVLVFVPILPLARYRIRRNGNSYQFYGKLPLRTFDKWHLGLALVAVVGLILMAVLGANSDSSGSYVADSGAAPQTHYTASEIAEQEAHDTSVAAKLPPLPYLTEYELKSRIDEGRVKISALESRIKPMVDEVNTLDEEMKPLQDELEGLKATRESGSKIDEVHYRQQADRFNADMDRREAVVAQANPLLEQYDLLIADDKRMVADYNERVQ